MQCSSMVYLTASVLLVWLCAPPLLSWADQNAQCAEAIVAVVGRDGGRGGSESRALLYVGRDCGAGLCMCCCAEQVEFSVAMCTVMS